TALDIFADPLTYVGVGAAGKFGSVAGKPLSRLGGRLLGEETAKVAAELAKDTSPIAEEMFVKGVKDVAEPEYRALVRDYSREEAKRRVLTAVEAGRTDLIDKGGIKFAGITVAQSPIQALARSGFSQALTKRLAESRAGAPVFAAGSWFKKNIADPLG